MLYWQPGPLGLNSPKRKLSSRGRAFAAITKLEQTAICKTGTSSTTKKFPTRRTLSQDSQRPLPPIARPPKTSRARASQDTRSSLKKKVSSAAAMRSEKNKETLKNSKSTNNTFPTASFSLPKNNFPVIPVLLFQRPMKILSIISLLRHVVTSRRYISRRRSSKSKSTQLAETKCTLSRIRQDPSKHCRRVCNKTMTVRLLIW